MTIEEYTQINLQIVNLEGLMPIYSGKTIDNVLSQLQARLKEYEKRV